MTAIVVESSTTDTRLAGQLSVGSSIAVGTACIGRASTKGAGIMARCADHWSGGVVPIETRAVRVNDSKCVGSTDEHAEVRMDTSIARKSIGAGFA